MEVLFAAPKITSCKTSSGPKSAKYNMRPAPSFQTPSLSSRNTRHSLSYAQSLDFVLSRLHEKSTSGFSGKGNLIVLYFTRPNFPSLPDTSKPKQIPLWRSPDCAHCRTSLLLSLNT